MVWYFFPIGCVCTVLFQISTTEVCRLVGTNFATKIRACHAHTFGGILHSKFRACAHSRRKFVPTNLPTSVEVGQKFVHCVGEELLVARRKLGEFLLVAVVWLAA